MNPQPQPATLNMYDTGMLQLIKSATYQLVDELRDFLDHQESTYSVYEKNQQTAAHNMRSMKDSVRAVFNYKYDLRYQALATYFSQLPNNIYTDAAQFGSLHVDQDTLSREQAIEIINKRIGWLLVNADNLPVPTDLR